MTPVGWSEERDGCWSMSEPERACGACSHFRYVSGVPSEARGCMRGMGACGVITEDDCIALVRDCSERAGECDYYEEAET